MVDRWNITSALDPNDLDTLKSVFNTLCDEGEVQPGSPKAERIAADLVWLFQSGTTDETTLLSAVRFRHQELKQTG
jgi:hypothetical protein